MPVKRKKAILCAAGVAVSAAIIAVAWPTGNEPTYQGKKLSEWLQIYHRPPVGRDKKVEAKDAVSQIGTNAIPWLLGWIGERPPFWSRTVGKLCASWAPAARTIGALQKRALRISDTRWEAAFGFEILGETASNAAPALVRLLNSDDPQKHWPADIWPPSAYALTRIGDAGVKSLLDWVSDPNSLDRNVTGVTTTLRNLGGIARSGTNADRVVSILIEGLRSPNKSVSFCSALALSGMDLNPSIVIETLRSAAKAGNVSNVRLFLQCLGPTRLAEPRVKEILLELQNDPDPILQNEAKMALLRIPSAGLTTNQANETNERSRP
jgi:hypothetical protein